MKTDLYLSMTGDQPPATNGTRLTPAQRRKLVEAPLPIPQTIVSPYRNAGSGTGSKSGLYRDND